MRAKVYIFLLTVAALGGGAWWANQNYDLGKWPPEARADKKAAEKKKAEEKAAEPVPVEIEAAVRGEIASRIRSTANLRALRDVTLKPQTQGVVTKIGRRRGRLR